MVFYQTGIQIYDQVSIIRSWLKAKLHSAVLLGFGLKESKITLNIMKVGMHSYLSNVHLNLWSNFHLKKLVKSETPSCGFVKVGVHACLWTVHPNKWSNFNSKKLVKSETPLSDFTRVGFKESQNNLKCCKSGHAHLSIKRASKSTIKFQFWEVCQKRNFVVQDSLWFGLKEV